MTSLDPSQNFTSVQVNGEERKKVVLQDELSEEGWATCQKCYTKNGVIPSPKRVLFEFLGGGALSLQGIEEDVNLGGSTYQNFTDLWINGSGYLCDLRAMVA